MKPESMTALGTYENRNEHRENGKLRLWESGSDAIVHRNVGAHNEMFWKADGKHKPWSLRAWIDFLSFSNHH